MTDHVPPQNLDAEKSTLGSCLLSKDAAIQVAGILTPDSFYTKAHRDIFSAILALADSQQPIDLITVTQELTIRNQLKAIGGASYLANLMNSVPTAENAEHYAAMVQGCYLKRQLIKAAARIAQAGYDNEKEAAQACDEAERELLQVTQGRISRGYVSIRDVAMETFTTIEKLYTFKGDLTGVPTGYANLDSMTAGWQDEDFIIVAARPSVGKTTFCLNLAANAAMQNNVPVGIFSIEMSRRQLGIKFLSNAGEIWGQRLKTGKLNDDDWPRLSWALTKVGNAPMWINDTPGIRLNELRAEARRMKAEHGIRLLVIDYLGLITTDNPKDTIQTRTAEVSRSLKALARELRIPVICCCQLNRKVESSTDKRPGLADLRDSGAIEQDADLVILLYRDDYYDPNEKPGETEIIFAKHRNGPTGTVKLHFDKELSRFEPLKGGASYAPTPAGHSYSGYSSGSHRQGRRSTED